jgi:prepilin-type N-terminal cleavage/methylation domain-containing protein
MAEHRRETGFTLIEVLVALAIVGLILVAVYRLFGTGVLNVGRGNEQLTLALSAEALLERTRADLDPRAEGLEGFLPNGSEWRMTAVPLDLPAPSADRATQGQAGREASEENEASDASQRGSNLVPNEEGTGARQRLWVVHVEVANRNGRTFTLSTLRWLPEQTS